MMYGFQAAGAAPIVLGHAGGEARNDRHCHPHRVIRRCWKQAVAARDESGGLIETVTDDEIVAAYRELATRQGVLLRACIRRAWRASLSPPRPAAWTTTPRSCAS